MKQAPSAILLTGLLGNLLDQCDKMLFALLAPFIGPLFFPPTDPLTSLLYVYGLLCLGSWIRPVGALFFAQAADKKGRKNILYITMLGISLTTAAAGFLPTYAQAGLLAPCLLVVTRLALHFFAAGDSAIAAVLVLEQAPPQHKSFVSSLFETSTIVGALLASCGVAIATHFSDLDTCWRPLLWGSSLSALCALYIRSNIQEPSPPPSTPFCWNTLLSYWRPIIAITCASGFSHVTYAMGVTFITAFLAIVSPLTIPQLSGLTTLLLLLDACLLPCFGWLTRYIAKEYLMIIAASSLALISPLLFQLLPHASFATALFVRLTIVILGVAFAAPLRLWAQELVPSSYRCSAVSLGCSLGRTLIGAPAAFCSLWLFQTTGQAACSGLYLSLSGVMAAGSVFVYSKFLSLAADRRA